jgi:nucleoside-diphosphate-sugar epimerase
VQQEDLGQAVCLGVAAQNLPSNFEVFHIFCDSPAGMFSIEKAKRVLGFKPRYNYESTWKRALPPERKSVSRRK